MPISFQFYDSIIALVQENISNHKRDTLTLKQNLAFNLHYQGDFMTKLLTKVGIYKDDEEDPLVFKHQAINQRFPQGLNHHNSEHSMSLQRSKYICLDDIMNKNFILKNE